MPPGRKDARGHLRFKTPRFTPSDEPLLLEMELIDAIITGKGFDLLIMGMIEREGCFCPINAALRFSLNALTRYYDLIIMDMEADLEHPIRRTSHDVDVLVIVTDLSKMSMETVRMRKCRSFINHRKGMLLSLLIEFSATAV